MRSSLSLLSLCFAFALVSDAAPAQRTQSAEACPSSTCCTQRARTLQPAMTCNQPAHEAVSRGSRGDETVTVSELARRLADPARREAVIDALRKHRLDVDTSDVETLVENASAEARRELSAAFDGARAAVAGARADTRSAVECAMSEAQRSLQSACSAARSTALALETKAEVEQAMSHAKHEMTRTLEHASRAQHDAMVAIAATNVEPAMVSALEALGAVSVHAGKHGASAGPLRSSARASRQDPADDSDADDSDDDGDGDGDEMDADGSMVVIATPEAPEALSAEANDEIARLPSALAPMADRDGDDHDSADDEADEHDGQKSKNGDANLDERVRALERIAHGDASSHWPPEGKDGRSLEQRVSDLERLLHERERRESSVNHGSATTPAPRAGKKGVLLTPDGHAWHVAPMHPGQPMLPMQPGQPGTPLLTVPPIPPAPGIPPTAPVPPGTPYAGPQIYTPSPEHAPKAFVVPHGGGYAYKVPQGELRSYSELTPEQKEKFERGMEKLERAKAKVKAKSDEERAEVERERADRESQRADRERERAERERERANARSPRSNAMSGDARRDVEQVLREMRTQMEHMREEMNRMRDELQRLPRNESR